MRLAARPDLRALALDAALVLGCVALAVLAVKGRWAPFPRPVIAVAGLLGSVAQWPRRRWPQVAAVVGAGSYVLSGNPGPLLVGLYTGAAYAPRRQVWAFAAAAWAGLVGLSWLGGGRPQLAEIAGWLLLAVLVTAFGVHMDTRNLLVESLRDRAERAEAERLRREEQARAAERTRIAREMHDVVAHKVSLIALHAGALELHASGDPARLREGAALIRVTAREALMELRNVLELLQGEPDDGAFPDLAALVEEAVRAGQPVELAGTADPLPPPTARVVYRVVQEALTNARKHAPGARTTVAVGRGADGRVTVTVDNTAATGPVLDLPGAGAGLVGLAERVRLAGGTLRSGPAGDGWRLEAVVPPAPEGAVR
jgi:signal transduction histidine kinase